LSRTAVTVMVHFAVLQYERFSSLQTNASVSLHARALQPTETKQPNVYSDKVITFLNVTLK
jgi:hypothetical protein